MKYLYRVVAGMKFIYLGDFFLGKVGKGVNCSVTSCKNPAERSISREQIGSSGLSVAGERRAFLCHDHYKIWKKTTKKDRELDRMRFN